MFVKVHKPVNTPCVCDNKDRCRALVEYLLKESLEDKPYYDTFFSHEEDYVAPVTVHFQNDRAKRKRKNVHTKRGAPSWVRLSILFLYCLIQAISFS